MDEEIERLVIGVRADTAGFARDVGLLREMLEGSLGMGADRAGRAIEGSLLRAVRTGKLGFDDLKAVAVQAMSEIAAASLRGGVQQMAGGGGLAGGLVSGLLALFGGAPGRATGGPVSPGRPYWVGERGPELFVPTASGSVAVPVAGGGGRDVRVSIIVHAGAGEAAGAMAQSSRQVARAVRGALLAED
ncbi:tail tape measure protein [Sphingomonas sp. Leaf17]|uniref:hypothetical protein n=1 Tax=Sphingomonas sp. Leaf17 TaxID=1735683 RepID=UPI0006FB92ED|nr:hypothetical protein [Sphingomonas sp. Leaf17]KQM64429.1 tail tape measure protein [Sphingomonas sp. Leaf17]